MKKGGYSPMTAGIVSGGLAWHGVAWRGVKAHHDETFFRAHFLLCFGAFF
jgi:hypothetical protein